MSRIVSRTISRTSTYVSVVISPATTTRPVVIRVSQATRAFGSSAMTASRTASEIWSAILSGCPSVTDSDVNWNVRALIVRRTLAAISGSATSLDGRLAFHQLRDKVHQRHPGEDRTDTLRDRHLHLESMRELAEHGRSGQPFDDHPDRASRLLRGRPLGDELAAAPVAARTRPARDDEVADPGEPREGLGPGSRNLGEPPHLGEAARDERRLGVVAEPKAVGATCRERDHVL